MEYNRESFDRLCRFALVFVTIVGLFVIAIMIKKDKMDERTKEGCTRKDGIYISLKDRTFCIKDDLIIEYM